MWVEVHHAAFKDWGGKYVLTSPLLLMHEFVCYAVINLRTVFIDVNINVCAFIKALASRGFSEKLI